MEAKSLGMLFLWTFLKGTEVKLLFFAFSKTYSCMRSPATKSKNIFTFSC